MSVKIRLARGGSKKRPFYRIVAADSRAPRDGKFIEKLGTYNPMLAKDNKDRVVLNEERIKYWLGQGATPSERVESFLVALKLFKRSKKRQAVLDKKIANSKEAAAKKKAEEEAKKKAEEEAHKAEQEAARKEAEESQQQKEEQDAADAEKEAVAAEESDKKEKQEEAAKADAAASGDEAKEKEPKE